MGVPTNASGSAAGPNVNEAEAINVTRTGSLQTTNVPVPSPSTPVPAIGHTTKIAGLPSNGMPTDTLRLYKSNLALSAVNKSL